jgi:hypothetical protein
VRATHDAIVVACDIHEELVEFDVLLLKGPGNVVKLHAGNCKNGLLVHFCVVETVEEMDAARTGRRQANTEPSGEFCVSASHECGRFLVPNMNKANLFLGFAEGFHDAIDAVARQTKDGINTPGEKTFYKDI